mmetsp:Transcript_25803/g.64049  ORF Transcript_25803/g.64049 Transcript_25803/m.64049 type:complete len:479 (+) Transcript_25803:1147-2583(+)
MESDRPARSRHILQEITDCWSVLHRCVPSQCRISDLQHLDGRRGQAVPVPSHPPNHREREVAGQLPQDGRCVAGRPAGGSSDLPLFAQEPPRSGHHLRRRWRRHRHEGHHCRQNEAQRRPDGCVWVSCASFPAVVDLLPIARAAVRPYFHQSARGGRIGETVTVVFFSRVRYLSIGSHMPAGCIVESMKRVDVCDGMVQDQDTQAFCPPMRTHTSERQAAHVCHITQLVGTSQIDACLDDCMPCFANHRRKKAEQTTHTDTHTHTHTPPFPPSLVSFPPSRFPPGWSTVGCCARPSLTQRPRSCSSLSVHSPASGMNMGASTTTSTAADSTTPTATRHWHRQLLYQSFSEAMCVVISSTRAACLASAPIIAPDRSFSSASSRLGVASSSRPPLPPPDHADVVSFHAAAKPSLKPSFHVFLPPLPATGVRSRSDLEPGLWLIGLALMGLACWSSRVDWRADAPPGGPGFGTGRVWGDCW